MSEFTHQRFGQRIHVTDGGAASALESEWATRDEPRVLLIATARAAAAVTLPFEPVAHIDRVREHVPADDVDAARELAKLSQAALLVTIGGGSATGLAKAIALELGLPIVTVPTTLAGSEATAMWGITADREKATGITPSVAPAAIIYDSALLATMPAPVAVASALNAFAHGIDALWAPAATPLSAVDAEAGIRELATVLDGWAWPPHPDRLEPLVVGTYLSAAAFAVSGSGMHHKICHVLGGAYGLPHAALHAVIIPHVAAFNLPADTHAHRIVGRALDTDDPDGRITALVHGVDGPRSLASIGMPYESLDEAARLCLDIIPASNPRSVDHDSVRALLERAWHGAAADA